MVCCFRLTKIERSVRGTSQKVFAVAIPVQIRQKDGVPLSKHPQGLKCTTNCTAEQIARNNLSRYLWSQSILCEFAPRSISLSVYPILASKLVFHLGASVLLWPLSQYPMVVLLLQPTGSWSPWFLSTCRHILDHMNTTFRGQALACGISLQSPLRTMGDQEDLLETQCICGGLL